ncbi:MAG: hypothetical protein NZM27_05430 [Acetobacteraceae bacterium]|nr:hypothetical protein [Acetobacteraceae bacterium]MDW8397880.1 hypothetical protein [Acetobacteraceae bacterium]
MGILGRVWRGDLPLPDLVWTWLLLGGLAVNLATSIGFLALVSAGEVWWALFVGYGLSLPYNLLVGVGCWRAAARDPAARLPIMLTRTLIAAFLLVLSLT